MFKIERNAATRPVLFLTIITCSLGPLSICALESVAQGGVGGGSALGGTLGAANARANALQTEQSSTQVIVDQQTELITSLTTYIETLQKQLDILKSCATSTCP